MPRPIKFDPVKQAQVCALLAVGHSRRDAARFVGCAPRTISHHAQHDPDFRAQLHQAEAAAKVLPFERLSTLTRKTWRSVAWLRDQFAAAYRRRKALRAAAITPPQNPPFPEQNPFETPRD